MEESEMNQNIDLLIKQILSSLEEAKLRENHFN
jgi:hypothetical protein